MGFLPNPSDKKSFGDKYPAGSPKGEASQKMIEWLKLGHGIIKAMITQAPESEIQAAEQALTDKLKSIGVTDEKESMALGSLILSSAIQISPAVYGEDYKEWGVPGDE